MNRPIKIIICVIIILIIAGVGLALSLQGKNDINDNGKMKIVVTTFSCYDLSRQIVGDKANVAFLLGPGVDAHSYEPSSGDLTKIQNADVFIYIGGEMEKWVDKVLDAKIIDENKTTLIKVSDCVETIEEQEVDGVEVEAKEEEDGAFDEHIWTSPTNAILMMEYLSDNFSKKDPENQEIYKNNSKEYIEKIKEVGQKIQEIVNNKKRDRLVFGDKMPMQYFLNEYDLKASAAFSGCSTEADPSAKTITYLINKVKEENIPVVLYIELSTGKTAKSIAKETGAKAMQIQTLHNISKEDFNNGETYVSLMTRNLDVLKEALQ